MSSSTRGRARADSTAEPDILANLTSFARHVRAKSRAPKTIVTYAKAVEQFDAFLGEPRRRRPRRVADVRREDVEAFLVERSDAGMRPATLSQRFRSLQQFFKWLATEGEMAASPMATSGAARPTPRSPPVPLREPAERTALSLDSDPRHRIGPGPIATSSRRPR